MKGKGKALVVGGSIAGLSCAHALLSIGWQVTLLEKTLAPSSSSATGAGLGLDPHSQRILAQWISHSDLLSSTVPLSVDHNRVTDSEKKVSWTLTRDDKFNYRAAYWTDLHSLLYQSLPSGVVAWGHQLLSFQTSNDDSSVVVKAKVLQSGDTVELSGDLLVAADGCLSTVRGHFLPGFKLRYSSYYAWRGVLDFSGKEHSDTIVGIRQAFPELGDCLYFDLANGTHCVLYELRNNKLNWVWYINDPEAEYQVKGNSVTMKVSDDKITKLHEEADKVWVPELARVIKETKEPFINMIYDSDPLSKIVWGNVVLVGDAAHPTTPHCLRSTNISIQDAAALGHCLGNWGLENITSALEEFQRNRLPLVSEQVLHARKLGRLKQGLPLNDQRAFDPKTASPIECLELQQRRMPCFDSYT